MLVQYYVHTMISMVQLTKESRWLGLFIPNNVDKLSTAITIFHNG